MRLSLLLCWLFCRDLQCFHCLSCRQWNVLVSCSIRCQALTLCYAIFYNIYILCCVFLERYSQTSSELNCCMILPSMSQEETHMSVWSSNVLPSNFKNRKILLAVIIQTQDLLTYLWNDFEVLNLV